ncbi:hypothetical protein BU16DRAFT_323663 [Lophium mytilinum]|uniref:Uncharacterized protein n=1 Tax=Lophium mytilinum TaxID=390894 RepID=A0A6A6QZN6_9PEZI|nr:hypothetical protein BU16DRAFT_323663 [Lophium mytilinum]
MALSIAIADQGRWGYPSPGSAESRAEARRAMRVHRTVLDTGSSLRSMSDARYYVSCGAIEQRAQRRSLLAWGYSTALHRNAPVVAIRHGFQFLQRAAWRPRAFPCFRPHSGTNRSSRRRLIPQIVEKQQSSSQATPSTRPLVCAHIGHQFGRQVPDNVCV